MTILEIRAQQQFHNFGKSKPAYFVSFMPWYLVTAEIKIGHEDILGKVIWLHDHY